MHKLFVLMLFKGADQTARMRRLVCAFVVHKLAEDRVSRYPESDLVRIKNNNVVRLWIEFQSFVFKGEKDNN